MDRDTFLTIDLKKEGKFMRYGGNIYENYNLFFIIENRMQKKKETFQVTYNGKMKAEPLGKFAGGIELRKGKNEITMLIKDLMGKEVYKEELVFVI